MRKAISKIHSIFIEVGHIIKWLYRYLTYPAKVSKLDASKEKVIIVGNGPSAGEFDYDKYSEQGYSFMCVNYFALDRERFFKLKPKYYCMVDPAFFTESGTPQKDAKIFELTRSFETVNWEMVLVCLSYQNPIINNDCILIEKLNNNTYEGQMNKLSKSLFDKNAGNFGYQNVLCAGLYYFIAGNAKEIGLIGVESDWHRELFVLENNDVVRECRHFYGTDIVNITELGQIKKGELYKYFYYYYNSLFGYYKAGQYAKMKNLPVNNYCTNSYIDVFEKKKA